MEPEPKQEPEPVKKNRSRSKRTGSATLPAGIAIHCTGMQFYLLPIADIDIATKPIISDNCHNRRQTSYDDKRHNATNFAATLQ